MTEKLDPTLLRLIESTAAHEVTDTVDVIVGLGRTADNELLADLAERGLEVRSVLGDILTGSVSRSQVRRVAAAGDVVKIEASGPLYPERREVPDESNHTE